ncbi:MAG: HNH endonuclease [Planctomycetes bacterium]|nr:HNH endonuclease [Planctomycetota bacterium]
MQDAKGLYAHVLVLNRHYAPIHIVTVRRALCLMCKGAAEAVDQDGDGVVVSYDFARWMDFAPVGGNGDDAIHGPTYLFRVPRVVRLVGYDRYPRIRVKLTRRNLMARDDYTCQYCGRPGSYRRLTLDHVTPRSEGGPDTWTNLVTACAACNDRKGGRTPVAAGMRLRRDPVEPHRNPVLTIRMRSERYRTWRLFIPD